MKNYLFIICLILDVFNVKAQINLVPNPSFEQFDTCPEYIGLTRYALGWTMNVNSADYFNSCETIPPLQVSTPTNSWGYQIPRTGNAYFGFYSYGQYNPLAIEFFGRSLSSALVAGQKYFVCFYVSLANGDPLVNPSIMCGTNNIGMKFFTYSFPSPLISNNLYFVNNYSQINSVNSIVDTLSWTKISGSFIADSAYTHFLIGRFFDNSNVTFSCLDSNNINNRWSYYYVDDICISTDSNTCNLITQLIDIESIQHSLAVIPNPSNGKIKFVLPANGNFELKICNLQGGLVYHRFINGVKKEEVDFNFSEISDGFYTLTLQNHSYVFHQKIILTKN
ncbi:MAG: T9SS type A sorting domain-containing protein [Bacteroidia bacterium]|nr:T9SS type A sorting domain-containing protein [Bacteroidia bacterium]MCZ2247894.1 T9SS type A sorting domain-containing protein [Bacteroidia bacterium]